jgi:hypothetical protein
MNYRLSTILDRELHSADTTKVIDITLADPISQLTVIYEPVNGAEATPDGHPAACITKIELVDGSDVLYSLTGQEAQAVDFYHRRIEPPNLMCYMNGMTSEMVYNINFGRHLWDPLLAFDPKKFSNPQLKVTIDINGGGCTVASGYLTVQAQIFDEKKITSIGFLMCKEIKDFALGAGTHEYTDMPTDFPYRKLFARIQKYAAGLELSFGKVKLTEDNDRRVPYNHTIFEILKSIVGNGPAYTETIITHGVTAHRHYYNTPCYWPIFASTGWTGSDTPQAINAYEGDGGKFQTVNTTAGLNISHMCRGYCPHGTIEIPFGLQDDPTDWYDVTKLGNLKLDLTSGSTMSSSETCQVFIQQLRSYAEAAT